MAVKKRSGQRGGTARTEVVAVGPLPRDALQREPPAAEAGAAVEAPAPSLPRRTSLVLRLKGAPTRVKEHGDCVERYEETDEGLSWGEKKARDGTWDEKWMQQAASTAGSRFGRSCGANRRLRQRWTCDWEVKPDDTHAAVKTVRRTVERYAENDLDTVLERWTEEIVEKTLSPTGDAAAAARKATPGEESPSAETPPQLTSRTCTKRGVDNETHRVWAVRITERDRDGGLVPTEQTVEEAFFAPDVNLLDAAGATLEPVKTITTSEVTLDNAEKHHRQVVIDAGDETVIEETRAAGDVDFSRSESRRKLGSATVDIKKVMRKDGVTTEERIQEASLTYYRDTWHVDKQNVRWGEKEERTRVSAAGPSSEVKIEKWRDDGIEHTVDAWVVQKEFDESNTVIQSLVERGYKKGKRHADGTEWCEDWMRTYEPASGAGAGTGGGIHTSADDGPHCAESVETASENGPRLTLRAKSTDKWWKEPSGNCWGERRFVDLRLSTERNEDWYNNQREEQHDRWEVTVSGERRGEKYGRSASHSREWREEWRGDAASAEFHVDKHWAETRPGQRVTWGETDARAGDRSWGARWELKHEFDHDTGSRFVERWERGADDGHTVRKEGSEWRDGATVNWYKDHFGEVVREKGTDSEEGDLGGGKKSVEKWAFKEGANAQGDQWVEKWNETPEKKSATKSGHNARGDAWAEEWREELGPGEERVTWAQKSGRNAQGDEWMESWFEEGLRRKTAQKKGRNFNEEWEEAWGETFGPEGEGEKWTSKWAREVRTGRAHGHNWGDRWGPGGGHRWGEEWHDGNPVNRWAYDTPGRPEGA